MSRLWHEIIRYADRLGPQEWFLVMAGLIIVGLVCMRGFGSRSGY